MKEIARYSRSEQLPARLVVSRRVTVVPVQLIQTAREASQDQEKYKQKLDDI